MCFVYYFQILYFCRDNADGKEAAFFQAGEFGLYEEAVIKPGEGVVCAEKGDISGRFIELQIQ